MFSQMNASTLALMIPALVALYFLPAILAVLLNRRHKGKIIAANVPAGFSWFLWFGVLAWAVTGRSRSEELDQ
jgi:multidrug efflux pump subunit AcrB